MTEQAQVKVQIGVENMIDELDKKYLRSMQADMHRCAARCSDDRISSMRTVQNCMEQCQAKLQRAQSTLEHEMNELQDQLSRCAQTCQDKTKQQIGPNTSESDALIFKSQLENCVIRCADDHVALLPNIQAKLVDSIKKL